MGRKHRRKEPEYEPIIRQDPVPYPADVQGEGRMELAFLKASDSLWSEVTAACIKAINDQSLLEDLQSLTLEQRIALELMKFDKKPFRENVEFPTFLSYRWAVATAAVITEVLPRQGLADEFLAFVATSKFREQVTQTFQAWYLPDQLTR